MIGIISLIIISTLFTIGSACMIWDIFFVRDSELERKIAQKKIREDEPPDATVLLDEEEQEEHMMALSELEFDKFSESIVVEI